MEQLKEFSKTTPAANQIEVGTRLSPSPFPEIWHRILLTFHRRSTPGVSNVKLLTTAKKKALLLRFVLPLLSIPTIYPDAPLQAYAPLVRAKRNDDPTLVSIAKAHGVSTTQVLVRWSLQRGFVPLPKSDNPDRIKNNADVFGFELTDEEMKKIDDKSLPGDEGAICPYLANVP